MTSKQYREIIRGISVAVMRRNFPTLNKTCANEAAREIAKNIHARMYGANVEGVDSPLWRNEDKNPKIDATELLKGNEDECKSM